MARQTPSLLGIGTALLAIGVIALHLAPRPTPAPEAPADPGPRYLVDAAAARRYAVARLARYKGPPVETVAEQNTRLAGEHDAGATIDFVADPYSLTFAATNPLSPDDGTAYHLAHAPDVELAFARDFQRHGFVREARCHAENARRAAGSAGAASGRIAAHAEQILSQLAANDLERRFPAGTAVLRDLSGALWMFSAHAPAPPNPAAGIERIGLATGDPEGALEHAFVLDERGRATAVPPQPAARPRTTAYRLRGVSLADALLAARLEHLAGLVQALPTLAPTTARERAASLADGYDYLGRLDDANRLRATWSLPARGDTRLPDDPIALGVIANDERHPWTLEARWAASHARAPRFSVHAASTATAAAALPVTVRAHHVDTIDVAIHRIDGPNPASTQALHPWIIAQEASRPDGPPVATATLDFVRADGAPTAYAIPLPGPGCWRVELSAAGLSVAIVATAVDARLDAFAFPSETVVRQAAGRALDVSPVETWTRAAGATLELHGPPARTGTSDARIRMLLAGPSGFFRASAQLDTRALAGLPEVVRGPVIHVQTDRPAYRAGDTIEVRAIVLEPEATPLRTATRRFAPAAGKPLKIALRAGAEKLFERTYTTGELGTASGRIPIPLAAGRRLHELAVTYQDKVYTHAFAVADYRESSYLISTTPVPGGLDVRGTYAWGDPVPGARVMASVAGKPAEPVTGPLALADGDEVVLVLERNGETLAQRELRHSVAPEPLPAAPPTAAPPAVPTAAGPRTPPPPGTPVATVALPSIAAERGRYGAGETIVLRVRSGRPGERATVLLADEHLYDVADVELDQQGEGTVSFPARRVHDPGVTAYLVAPDGVAQARLAVRAALMPVSIELPPRARPGERVTAHLTAAPDAELALAVVDERIFAVRADATPNAYRHAYLPRIAALASSRVDQVEYDAAHRRVARPVVMPGVLSGQAAVERAALALSVERSDEDDAWVRERHSRERLVARAAGGSLTENAVNLSLRWLATQQSPDGAWRQHERDDAVGTTSLAVLAFLGTGHTHRYGTHKEPVKRALVWLMGTQTPEGRFGTSDDGAQALGSLALAEAYGMTKSPILKDAALRAAAHLRARQRSDGTWPSASGEPCPITTIWALFAWKSARAAELDEADPTHDPRPYLHSLLDPDAFLDRGPTELAGALIACRFLGDRPHATSATIQHLLDTPLATDPLDARGTYFAMLAAFQGGGEPWRAMQRSGRFALLSARGPDGSWTDNEGAIRATAYATMTLSIYYRYAKTWDGAPEPEEIEPRVRVSFPDTAFWNAHVRTDAAGRAAVEFLVPDRIGTLFATARGLDAQGALGEGTARLVAAMDVFVELVHPPFLVTGDTVVLRATVHNRTAAPLEARVWIAGGELTPVRVPAGGSATRSRSIEAGLPGTATLEARIAAGSATDAVRHTIPVLSRARPRITTSRVQGAAGTPVGFQVPAGATGATLVVREGRDASSVVLDALAYLADYPHG